LGFLAAQVHAHALLAAVVLDPVGTLLGDPRRVIAGLLAPDALDLDDLGSQPGEHLSAARPRLMASQVDHADPVERTFLVGPRNTLCLRQPIRRRSRAVHACRRPPASSARRPLAPAQTSPPRAGSVARRPRAAPADRALRGCARTRRPVPGRW